MLKLLVETYNDRYLHAIFQVAIILCLCLTRALERQDQLGVQ
jgi:hypothetical protein